MASFTSSLIIKLIDQASAPSRAISRALAGVTSAQERNSRALAAANGKMLGAAAAGYGLYKALSKPTEAAIEFESKLEDIAQKVDAPISALNALGKEVRAVASDTSQSASDIAEGMDVLAGMGASRKDSLELLKPIGRAATAYKASIADLSQAGYAALDNLKVPADQFGAALDAMAQAGKAGAFELKDMAQYFPALGAGYQALGQTGVPAVADLSAALQIVRKGTGDSASAATNLSNILQKMNSPLTNKNFAKMGVDLQKELKKAATLGMSPIEAIAEITNRTLKGDMSKLGYLFNDAQVQQGLRPLLQNIDLYRQIRKEAMDAQGVVEEDYQRRLKTGGAAAKRFGVAFENINLAIGAALLPVLADFAEILVPIITRITDFIEANPALTRAILLSASAFVALRIAMVAGRYGFLLFKGQLLSAQIGLLRFIQLAASVSLSPLRVGLMALTNPIGLVARAFGLLRLAMISTGIGAIIVALAMAGVWIYNNWSGVSTAFMAFKDALMQSLGPVMPLLQPIIDGITWLWDGLSNLLGPIDASEAAWASFGTSAGQAVGSIIKGIIELPAKIWGFIKAIPGYLSSFAMWFAEAGAHAAVALSDAIWNGITGILKWFYAMPEKILRALAGTDIAKALGLDGALNMAADLMGSVSNAVNAGIDKLSEFREAIKSKAGDFFEAGKNLMFKLWDGIKEIMGQIVAFIKDSISNAASQAWAGIKSKFPSWMGGGDDKGSSQSAVDGARATGGPVRAGGTYLVGEKGPELFTTRNNGIIHPANATSGYLKNMVNLRQPTSFKVPNVPAGGNAVYGSGQGKSVTVNMGGVNVSVSATPTMDVKSIADEVLRKIGDEMNRVANSAFSDGVYS